MYLGIILIICFVDIFLGNDVLPKVINSLSLARVKYNFVYHLLNSIHNQDLLNVLLLVESLLGNLELFKAIRWVHVCLSWAHLVNKTSCESRQVSWRGRVRRLI